MTKKIFTIITLIILLMGVNRVHASVMGDVYDLTKEKIESLIVIDDGRCITRNRIVQI